MKITEIRWAGLRGETPEGGWSTELQPDDCVHTLVAVHTDEGLTGVGSVFTSEALVGAAMSVLEPLLRGENALEPERVSEKLHQHTFWLGRGGAITHAISGIDIALWDILGQATGQPVGRLLGGRYRERVQPYASLLMDEPEKLRDTLQAIKAQGFRAFKIGWGPFGRRNAATDRAIVCAARDAIGPECRLMVDAGGSDAYWTNGYKWALRTSHMLAEYDVHWFEEALNPDHLAEFVRLREHSPVSISGGEVLTRRQTFLPWIEQGAFDIIQPDVTKVGGISEERRIAWWAEEHGIQFIPHGWNTALGLAADLHLASAVPGTDMVEYITGSPFIDDIVAEAWKLDADGWLDIPTAPGLGVKLNLDAVDRLTGGKALL
ncbi:mandelate racemase/muconate lactonizing enzyme family protein [Synoicihabitans lomoniglobus]|uniref:Mandelate racemase/muconate lactonizing enzyme family protein n=1 Tax=Synoicihabitans lomoniglobus TaxID=2909285 RepID=A0AAF0CHB2_9BACT|nr:mandelate racemase/muconate lactonizing enzyme family protein [Opitutaceae bacterium LMO-M01]WED64097.1 mandelate racemase/muconate lactonizing enzyme family protein [Opitutaceae bacterium LMO-M01]